jgi:NTE family protein
MNMINSGPESNSGTGLVLSGGGARGIAHAGVLKALDELKISIDIISGTSSGALIALLYSGGVAPGEIPGLVKKNKLFEPRRFRLDMKGLLKSDLFRKILSDQISVRNFEDLKIPVRISATDFTHGRIRVFDKGPFLEPAVASCSIPLIFAPVNSEGVNLVDGGLVNNLPVELVEGRCRKIIGVNVNPIGIQSRKNLSGTIERIFQIIVNSGIEHRKNRCDIFIEPESLSQYAVFDTMHADELFEAGYNETMKRADELLKL